MSEMEFANSGQSITGKKKLRTVGYGHYTDNSGKFLIGWNNTRLSNISNITIGQSPPGNTYNTIKIGLPFFQGKAEFGKLYQVVRKYCSSPKKIARKGDILLSVRAPVGPTNICDEKCCLGRGLSSIHVTGNLSQEFIHYYLISIQEWLSFQGTGSTFQAIGKDFLYNLSIPLPPLNEQKRIVAKLDAIIPRIAKLTQSILAKTFRGELTPQDPDDEPAEKLLERIMAEKAKMEGALKGAKKKGAGQKAKARSRK
ncbi:MAG: restriction endonuclease subunit S [Proteobacteria bacterium]|nr:restriction endonuclease subunit S [Pseudomonadota bacterium]MBU1581438.1 restriction endonuclease subunit S [Pseudomonadota bacterium]MBU2454833.1 restriction endonuclease subunit S [Pseudomonadota bacterium]